MHFNPGRLRIARKRRSLKKKNLAACVGVTAHTISRCERGQTIPTENTVSLIANALNFPMEFFYGVDVDEPNAAFVSFRSQLSMSATERNAALAAGSIGFLISDWVVERFNLPDVNLPDLHLYDAERAARVLREEWHLGEIPISNMIHLLESKGIRVFSLAEDSRRVNAYSLWRNGIPYVFLNTMKSSENSRFDAAHELAHLVLHQDGQMTGRAAEDQANAFASSFLMPEADVISAIPIVHGLDQIIDLKVRWRVSAAALNYRLHKLALTSDWKYRDFCIQLSALGYTTKEPKEIGRERSAVWQKVLRALWAERMTTREIALAIHVPEEEVDALVFGILQLERIATGLEYQSLSLVGRE